MDFLDELKKQNHLFEAPMRHKKPLYDVRIEVFVSIILI
jgi:hypothetical protein